MGEGEPDRRAQSPRPPVFNGGTKLLLMFIAGMMVSFILPKIWDVTTDEAVSGTIATHNRSDIEFLDNRLRYVESEVAKGGRWTSRDQMSVSKEQALKDAQQDATLASHAAACAARGESVMRMLNVSVENVEALREELNSFILEYRQR